MKRKYKRWKMTKATVISVNIFYLPNQEKSLEYFFHFINNTKSKSKKKMIFVIIQQKKKETEKKRKIY